MKIKVGNTTARVNKSKKIISLSGKEYHLSQTGAGRFAKYSIDKTDVKGYITERYNEKTFVFYKDTDHKIKHESPQLYESIVGILGRI